ncbi:MAG: hypothetical protein AB1513_10620 [Pseudomonadota bacterium]
MPDLSVEGFQPPLSTVSAPAGAQPNLAQAARTKISDLQCVARIVRALPLMKFPLCAFYPNHALTPMLFVCIHAGRLTQIARAIDFFPA